MARQAKRSDLLEKGRVRCGGSSLSYQIRAEHRQNVRFSLTKTGAYLRLPYGMRTEQQAKQRRAFMEWLEQTLRQKPDLRAQHTPKHFRTGSRWRLGNIIFRLNLQELQRKSVTGQLVEINGEPVAQLKVPPATDEHSHSRAIEKVLYELAAQVGRGRVERLLAEINAAHFNVETSRLKLSATSSRWGSCSSTGTISISSRLLGAPDYVLRAVLVHELAHRLEMNHSPAFWAHVYRAEPNYDLASTWLRQHGETLYWQEEQ